MVEKKPVQQSTFWFFHPIEPGVAYPEKKGEYLLILTFFLSRQNKLVFVIHKLLASGEHKAGDHDQRKEGQD